MTHAVLLMGPTATGKTNLALRLAEDLPIEIISVDSALVYTDMDIGTAKPSKLELQKVKHYLINIISPVLSYSVANFIDDSVKLIHDICARGKIPVLVGGTMMYYNALINGISKLPVADALIRAQIEEEALHYGWQELYAKLTIIDPVAAAKIKSTDKQRISRALEVYYLTSNPISVLQSESNINKADGINFLSLGIMPEDREVLHNRIAKRFSSMLENGLIEEVESLRIKYPELTMSHPSMRSVGYNQAWQYLDGQISQEELYNMGVAATRQLAKRQITWIRKINPINLAVNDLEFNTLYKSLQREINRAEFKS